MTALSKQRSHYYPVSLFTAAGWTTGHHLLDNRATGGINPASRIYSAVVDKLPLGHAARAALTVTGQTACSNPTYLTDHDLDVLKAVAYSAVTGPDGHYYIHSEPVTTALFYYWPIINTGVVLPGPFLAPVCLTVKHARFCVPGHGMADIPPDHRYASQSNPLVFTMGSRRWFCAKTLLLATTWLWFCHTCQQR